MNEFTHKGSLLLCPIKIGKLESDCPVIAARWFWLEPWLWLNCAAQCAMIFLLTMIDPDYEPMWMFKVTGKLDG